MSSASSRKLNSFLSSQTSSQRSWMEMEGIRFFLPFHGLFQISGRVSGEELDLRFGKRED